MIYANYLELKEMAENKQLTDIYLICKGWYNKKLYDDELEAMNTYYHKHYSGCDDIVMDIPFALHLFLKPLALEIINRDPNKARYREYCNFDFPQNIYQPIQSNNAWIPGRVGCGKFEWS